MSNLKQQLIRLGEKNFDLRENLRPILDHLAKTANDYDVEYYGDRPYIKFKGRVTVDTRRGVVVDLGFAEISFQKSWSEFREKTDAITEIQSSCSLEMGQVSLRSIAEVKSFSNIFTATLGGLGSVTVSKIPFDTEEGDTFQAVVDTSLSAWGDGEPLQEVI